MNKIIEKLFGETTKGIADIVDDSTSDSWLSKNIRPLVLLILVISTILLVFIDAGKISFEVKESWVDLLQIVLITVIGAYFGSRGLEKYNKK